MLIEWAFDDALDTHYRRGWFFPIQDKEVAVTIGSGCAA